MAWNQTFRSKLNTRIDRGDYWEIIILRKGESHSMLIDKSSMDILPTTSIFLVGHGYNLYSAISIEGKSVRVHRLLLNTELFVDHIDGNRLNNRLANLRTATRSQNGANRRIKKVKSSTYLGVSWYKSTSKWLAQLTKDGVVHSLGYYLSEEEAAKAYDAAASKYHGEFARRNFNV